jgi:hypothetical protein
MASAKNKSKRTGRKGKGGVGTAPGHEAEPPLRLAPEDEIDGDAPAGDGPARSSAMGLEVDDEVLEFIAALERFKKANNRPFPGWSEVLFVLKQLGYRR